MENSQISVHIASLGSKVAFHEETSATETKGIPGGQWRFSGRGIWDPPTGFARLAEPSRQMLTFSFQGSWPIERC